MPIKKKPATKKPVKKKISGIVAYNRAVNNSPKVKAISKKIDDLDKKLKALKKLKAAAVKVARKQISAKR
jgi:hypothetical protein